MNTLCPARAVSTWIATPRTARGATLIVGMLLLLLMTTIALTSLKAIKTDEHLTGNTQDRHLAFQAAEASLREAERMLEQPALPPFDGTDGLYLYSATNIPGPLELDDNNARRYTETLAGVDQSPLYIIERMEAGVEQGDSLVMGVRYGAQRRSAYRITATGYGGSATTRVVLQTTFKR
jgi:type IV pilus assembly protein PilX